MDQGSLTEFLFLTSEDLRLVGNSDARLGEQRDVLNAWFLRNKDSDFQKFFKNPKIKKHQFGSFGWLWLASKDEFLPYLEDINLPLIERDAVNFFSVLDIKPKSLDVILKIKTKNDDECKLFERLKLASTRYMFQKIKESDIPENSEFFEPSVDHLGTGRAYIAVLFESKTPILEALNKKLLEKNHIEVSERLVRESSKNIVRILESPYSLGEESFRSSMETFGPLFDGDLKVKEIAWQTMSAGNMVLAAKMMATLPHQNPKQAFPSIQVFKNRATFSTKGGFWGVIENMFKLLDYPFDRDPEGSEKFKSLAENITTFIMYLILSKSDNKQILTPFFNDLKNQQESVREKIKNTTPSNFSLDLFFEIPRLLGTASEDFFARHAFEKANEQAVLKKLDQVEMFRKFFNDKSMDTAEWFLKEALGVPSDNLNLLPVCYKNVTPSKPKIQEILDDWVASSERYIIKSSLGDISKRAKTPAKKI